MHAVSLPLSRLLVGIFLMLGNVFCLQAQEKDRSPNIRLWGKNISKYLLPAYADSLTERQRLHLDRTLHSGIERFYPSGSVGAYAQAYNHPYAHRTTTHQKSNVPDIFQWTELGPSVPTATSDGTGRIHRIFLHPRFNEGERVIYACSPYGGLWRKKLGTEGWEVLSEHIHNDESKNLLYTGVADGFVHPENEWIYIASGGNDNVYDTYNGSFKFNPVFTQGLFRSKDNGQSWEAINTVFSADGFPDWGHFEQLVLHPLDPNIALAIGTHGLYMCYDITADTPVWFHTFSGSHYPLYTQHETLRGIAFHPTNPYIFYVSGRQIYRTTDGGTQWQNYQNLYPNFSLTPQPYDRVTRVNIDLATNNPDRLAVYVTYMPYGTNDSEVYAGLVEQGEWVAHRGNFTNQSPRLMPVRFFPNSDNACLFANQAFRKLGDIPVPNQFYYHVDISDIEFVPSEHQPGKYDLLFSGDGGVYRCFYRENGQRRTENLSEGLSVATVHSFDVTRNGDFLLCARQDNKVFMEHNGVWTSKLDGDGFFARFSPNEDSFFCQSQKELSACSRWSGTTYPQAVPFPAMPLSAQANMVNKYNRVNITYSTQPFFFPAEQKWLFGGRNDVYSLHKIQDNWCPTGLNVESIDDSESLWDIETDVRHHIGHPGEKWQRPISEVASSLSEADPWVYVVYSGAHYFGEFDDAYSGSALFRARKSALAAGDWNAQVLEKLSFTGGPHVDEQFHQYGEFFPIMGIEVHPENSNVVWICFVGHDHRLKVWKSEDAGATWHNLDAQFQLPNISVNDLIYVPGTQEGLVVGTDGGLFWYDATTGNWNPSTGFPRCRIVEMKLNPEEDALYVASWGRGIWKGVFTHPEQWLFSDLYAKDTPGDLGDEPYDAEVYWESPDLTVHPQQIVVGGRNNHVVQVTVRNRGSKTSAANLPVDVYWSVSGEGLLWPQGWKGQTYCDALQTLPYGGAVGQGVLPALAPGEQRTLEIPWHTVPNPADYVSRCGFAPGATFHVCFTALINEPALTLQSGEPWSHITNVRKQNNVVQKNQHFAVRNRLAVIDHAPAQVSGAHVLVYTGSTSQSGLGFTLEDFSGGQISQSGEVKLQLDDVLMKKWLEGGQQGRNVHLQTVYTSEMQKYQPQEVQTLPMPLQFIVLDSTEGEVFIPDPPAHHAGLQYLSFSDTLPNPMAESQAPPGTLHPLLDALAAYIQHADSQYLGLFRMQLHSPQYGLLGGNSFQVYGVNQRLGYKNQGKASFSAHALLQAANQISASGTELEVYPNPTADVLHLHPVLEEVHEICMYSAQGQKMLCHPAQSNIKVNALPPGTYFVVLTQPNGNIINVKKWIKQ